MMMELYIETLTGSGFELRVSPYETIQDIKGRIQKLEAIPVSHQHLIWQSIELEDDYCLSDYGIHDGATLKLVLTMRGGPINTRRIPVEDPTLREMAEYLSESSRDEHVEKMPGNRPVTVIVYHNGDQLNFYRVVDRDSASPLSESLSGASMYNLYDDEEDEESPSSDQAEENDKTREKMKILRKQMEGLTLKKPKKKSHVPRPPSSGRPNSKARLRRMPSHSGKKSASGFHRTPCLPPVGQGTVETDAGPCSGLLNGPTSVTNPATHCDTLASKDVSIVAPVLQPSPPVSAPFLRRLDSVDSVKVRPPLASVREDQDDGDTRQRNEALESLLLRTQKSLHRPTPPKKKIDFSPADLLGSAETSQKKDVGLEALKESLQLRGNAGSKGLERLLEAGASNTEATASGVSSTPKTSSPGVSNTARWHSPPSTKSLHKDLSLGSLQESLARPAPAAAAVPSIPSSKYVGSKPGVILESLHPSEVRAMSGMLSSMLVRSATKSRTNYTHSSKDGRSTPEHRLVSARHLQRLSASREGRISPSHRLPPVKPKKKSSKRCYVCCKKTGLATSYQCRCGNNFCATHRYAEAHSCTYDYKSEGRKLLEQSNPVVTAPKLPKI